MSPELGRFLQPDPIGYADSTNLYQGLGGNPVNSTDPLGLLPAPGVDPEQVLTTYLELTRFGYSTDSAYRILISSGYVVETGNKQDDLYKLSLALTADVRRLATEAVKTELVVAGAAVTGGAAAYGLGVAGSALGLTAATPGAVGTAVNVGTFALSGAVGGLGGQGTSDLLERRFSGGGAYFRSAVLGAGFGGAFGYASLGPDMVGSFSLPAVEPHQGAVRVRRPYLRASTRATIRDAAPTTPEGRYIDPNTGGVIEDKFHYGHKYGYEHRRLVIEATTKSMTQQEFNDWVNSHPDWFQIEDPAANLSHAFEKPGTE